MRWPFANWLRGAPGGDDPSPGASGAAAAATDPAPASGPEPGPPGGARPPAWRDQPPVQRAVGAAPLTAPSAEFARGLAGRRTPDPMLAPLGHDLTSDGPAGLVSGIAVPLVQRTAVNADPRSSAAELPAARGRARPAVSRGLTSTASLPRSGAVTDTAGPAATEPPGEGAVSVAAGHMAAAEPTTPAEPAAALPGLALRTLPVARLATGAAAGVAPIAATRVADVSAPAPVVAHAPSVGAGPPARESVTPAGTAASPDAPVTVSRATDAVSATPQAAPAVPPLGVSTGGDPGHPVSARRTLGESRRLGLGAPLTDRPPLSGREAGRSDLPLARLQRSADLATTTARLPIAPVVPAAAAASFPLPRLVVARRPATSPEATAVPAAASPAAGAVDQGPPATPAGSIGEPAEQPGGDLAGLTTAGLAADAPRPLTGDVPIGVSRLVRGDPGVTDVAATTDAAGAPEQGGPALHLAAASGARPATPGPAIGAKPGAPGADTRGMPADANPGGPSTLATLQRSGPLAVRGALTAAPGAATAGRPVPAVAPLVATRALRAGSPIVPANTGPGSAVERAPVVARLAIPWPGPDFGADATGSAPFGAMALSPAHPTPAPAALHDERPVVARSALAAGRGPSSALTASRGPSPAPGSALPVARSAFGGAERVAHAPDEDASDRSGDVVSWAAGTGFTTVAPTPGPFVQRAVTIDDVSVTPGGDSAGPAGGAGQGAGQAGAGGAGTDYEELAEQLYDKIRARLTTELLLDRERAGLLVDG